jgi:hypothetical protein
MLALASFVLAAVVAQEPALACIGSSERTFSVEAVTLRGGVGVIHASMPDYLIPCSTWTVAYMKPPNWEEIPVPFHFKYNSRNYIEFQMNQPGYYRVNNYNCQGDPSDPTVACYGYRGPAQFEQPWIWLIRQAVNQ